MTDKAMDQLSNQFQDMSMSFLIPPKEIQNKERTLYVQQKINPTEQKDIQALEAKLALTYTEKKHNEKVPNALKQALKAKSDERKTKQAKKLQSKTSALPKVLITRETKLAAYVEELEREFDERKALEAKETEILEAYANKHFKPTTLAKRLWESEESRLVREKEVNMLARQKFILENKDKVLGAVLRKEIRQDEFLQQEDKAQYLLSPFYAKRIQELKNELISIDSDRKNARYYAKQPKPEPKNITNDEPTLPNAITAHYRLSLLKNELSKPIVQDKITAEEKQRRQELIKKNTARSDEASEKNSHIIKSRVQDGHAKPFRRLVE